MIPASETVEWLGPALPASVISSKQASKTGQSGISTFIAYIVRLNRMIMIRRHLIGPSALPSHGPGKGA